MQRRTSLLLLAALLTLSGPAFAGWGYWSPVATGLPHYDGNGGPIQYCFNGEDDPRYIMASVQVDDYMILGHYNPDPTSPTYNPGGELVTLKALPWYYQWSSNVDLFWWGDIASWGYLQFPNQPSGSPGWAAFPPLGNNTRAQCRVS